MADEHFVTYGAEQRTESNRLLPRVLLFGLVLLMVHVLEVKPSDVDLGGVKIGVKDAVVIRGGLALVYLFHFWMMVTAVFEGSHLLTGNVIKRVTKSLISGARKPYRKDFSKKRVWRTPKQVKRYAWWSMFAFNVFIAPFAFVCSAIIISAIIIAGSDAIDFIYYVIGKLTD